MVQLANADTCTDWLFSGNVLDLRASVLLAVVSPSYDL